MHRYYADYLYKLHRRMVLAVSVILLLFSVLLSLSVFSQHLISGEQKFSSSTLVSFSAILYDGKVYVNWVIKGEKKDGLYLIERSEDGNNYKLTGWRDGIGTPLDLELLYSWIDEHPEKGTTYYRLKRVNEDGSVDLSDRIIINNGEQKSQPVLETASRGR